jgi:hypothetical protein
MKQDWPILEVVGTEEEARLIEGFLEARDIECDIESLRFNQEPVNFGRLGEVRLRVPPDALDRARAELDELRSGEPILAEGDEASAEPSS